MKEGKIHIYTGNGKGKTTAALGLGLRASGADKKVLVIQFMKPGSSEADSIKQVDNYEVQSYGAQGFIEDKKEEFREEQKEEVMKALERTKEVLDENYDLLILDELISALHFDLVNLDEVKEILDRKPKNMELVLTGRNAPEKLKKTANLVTEMNKIKHYYDEGVEAREGIEY